MLQFFAHLRSYGGTRSLKHAQSEVFHFDLTNLRKRINAERVCLTYQVSVCFACRSSHLFTTSLHTAIIQIKDGIVYEPGVNDNIIERFAKHLQENAQIYNSFCLSHDATPLLPHPSIDIRTRRLYGFKELNSEDKLVFPQEIILTEQAFMELIKSRPIGTGVYLYVLQDVLGTAKPVVVAVLIIEKTPPPDFLAKCQAEIIEKCEKNGIKVDYTSADGDLVVKNHVQNNMYTEIDPTTSLEGRFKDNHGLLVYDLPNYATAAGFTPDGMHHVSKSGQQMLSSSRPLRLGRGIITQANLRSLLEIQKFPELKGRLNLTIASLDPHQRQDWKERTKLFNRHTGALLFDFFQKQQPCDPNMIALSVYVRALGGFCDAVTKDVLVENDPSSPTQLDDDTIQRQDFVQRLILVFSTTYFTKLWRCWLEHEKLNIKENWISTPFAEDIVLSSHFNFFLALRAQVSSSPIKLRFSKVGSVACELVFGGLRTFDRVTQDFDALGCLRKLERLFDVHINDKSPPLHKKDISDAHKKRTSIIPNLSDAEIIEAMDAAWAMALSWMKDAGMEITPEVAELWIAQLNQRTERIKTGNGKKRMKKMAEPDERDVALQEAAIQAVDADPIQSPSGEIKACTRCHTLVRFNEATGGTECSNRCFTLFKILLGEPLTEAEAEAEDFEQSKPIGITVSASLRVLNIIFVCVCVQQS